MAHEPVVASLLYLEARRGAQVVFAWVDCRSAGEGHVAQLLHCVSAAAPEITPVLHEDQRAILFLQHVFGVELQHTVWTKQSVIATAVGNRFATNVRSAKFAAIHVDGAAPGTRWHGSDVLHARETQTHLEGKLQTG